MVGDRYHPVRGHRGAKYTLETAYPVGFCGPFRIDREADVIKRVDQPAGGKLNRRPEIIGVDDIRMAEGGIQVGLIPESARGLARQVAGTIFRVLARIWIRDWHFSIEVEVPKAWIERITMLWRDRKHGLDHRVGIISAAGLSGSSL